MSQNITKSAQAVSFSSDLCVKTTIQHGRFRRSIAFCDGVWHGFGIFHTSIEAKMGKKGIKKPCMADDGYDTMLRFGSTAMEWIVTNAEIVEK